MTYIMSTKTGDVVIKREANSLEEAIDFFCKLKQLPRKEFLKLFLVTELKHQKTCLTQENKSKPQ